jgi:hypothetical protein
MIKFKASPNIQRITGIDYNLLSNVFVYAFPIKRHVTLKIEKARRGNAYSAYYPLTKTIRLYFPDNLPTIRYTISTILHETRHYFHFKLFPNNMRCDYSSHAEYYNSPEERDARKTERLTTEICGIYSNIIKLQKKIQVLNLNTFEELEYNWRKAEESR